MIVFVMSNWKPPERPSNPPYSWRGKVQITDGQSEDGQHRWLVKTCRWSPDVWQPELSAVEVRRLSLIRYMMRQDGIIDEWGNRRNG